MLKESCRNRLAIASALLVVLVDSDRVRIISIQLGLSLLLQRSTCDGLESLLDVDSFLCTGLKVRNVALALAPGHGAFLRDHAFALFNVDLVAENNEGKVFGIVRCSLDEKFVSPRIERFKGLCIVDVVAETATVSSSVEGHTKRLETFLTGGVPELHGDKTIVYHNFACEKVGTDGGLVSRREALVYVC